MFGCMIFLIHEFPDNDEYAGAPVLIEAGFYFFKFRTESTTSALIHKMNLRKRVGKIVRDCWRDEVWQGVEKAC